MFNYKNKTEFKNWIILTSVLLLVIEIAFFNQGVIFSVFFSSVAIYIGRKKRHRVFGKFLFWFGAISLFMTIINMITIKFLLVAGIIYLIVHFAQAKQNPIVLKPEIIEAPTFEPEIIKRRPFFTNSFFGGQRTPEHVYEWNDINIHTGIGDTVIDLSYTVLPKGEVVISVRNFIGNIQILVPYDLEVNVSHSAINGSTLIFQTLEEDSFNQTVNYYTENYEQAEQKIKIITSIVLGNLEVKRI